MIVSGFVRTTKILKDSSAVRIFEEREIFSDKVCEIKIKKDKERRIFICIYGYNFFTVR